MNEFVKNTWAFWGLVIFAVGITVVIVGSASAENITETEIDEFQEPVKLIQGTGQTDDEIGKIIKITIEDGISSSDSLK